MTDPVSMADIEVAAARIGDHVLRTPLLSAPIIDARTGARVLFKPECLQRTGSFKFRGASNAIASLDRTIARNGVVAFSSGNHAQGVAAAATAHGLSSKIVMPVDSPAIKLANTRQYGGEVVTYDRYTEDRDAIAHRIAAEEGRALIPPFDHEAVIAGQGTVGLEIADDLNARSQRPDMVLCCCGGGGLIAGLSIAFLTRYPDTAIWAVEPEGYDDTRRSLISGQREKADLSKRSFCDALLSPMPGEKTFAINSQRLAGGLVVSDDEVRDAMRVAFSDLKVVVEPGGAVALAALLSGKAGDVSGKTVVVILSGGNVDAELFSSVIAG